jgi:hypothetical protein
MCLVDVDTLWVVNSNCTAPCALEQRSEFPGVCALQHWGIQCVCGFIGGLGCSHAASKAHGNLKMVEVSRPLS